MKSRSYGIGISNYGIALKFDRYIGSCAADVPVKCQSGWLILNGFENFARSYNKTAYRILKRDPGLRHDRTKTSSFSVDWSTVLLARHLMGVSCYAGPKTGSYMCRGIDYIKFSYFRTITKKHGSTFTLYTNNHSVLLLKMVTHNTHNDSITSGP